MQAIISIHDVMPQTLSRVGIFLDCLQRFPANNICLLVVPGRQWQPEQIRQLHHWQQQGYELAGHGWRHEVTQVRGLYHTLHSRLVSRSAAEHLPLDTDEIAGLIDGSYRWFQQQGLAEPELYVPPAWAMGSIRCSQLQTLPYRYYEFQSGLYDSNKDRFRYLPLAGFEAQRRWQVPVLRLWNRINHWLATSAHPLRLSIHPYDLDYYLGKAVLDSLAQVTASINYRTICQEAARQSWNTETG